MSGATESLGHKLSGAADLRAVVRSMKAMAASSIGQYEKAIESLDEYRRSVELGLSACLRWSAVVAPPVARSKPCAGAVIFGSDQGLVGRFNETLMDCVVQALGRSPATTRRIWAVGERVRDLITDSAFVAPQVSSVPSSVEAITSLVNQILVEVEAALEMGDVGEIHLFHNRPTAFGSYEPVCTQLLPLDRAWQQKLAGLKWPTQNLPEVVETAQPAIAAFIREYLFVLLFQACAESLASENASRLAAMQRAEKNIEQILADLRRRFQRTRQESIDEELFEVVAGYEALESRT